MDERDFRKRRKLNMMGWGAIGYQHLFFLATFIDILDYAILYLQTLWLVGTSGKNSQIPLTPLNIFDTDQPSCQSHPPTFKLVTPLNLSYWFLHLGKQP